MRFLSQQLRIGGMTCVNCQNKIEKKLRNTAGIEEAAVSYSKGTAEIRYDTDLISLDDIIAIIEKMDYEVLSDQTDRQPDVGRVVCLLLIIVALYIILQQFGILNLLVPSQLADATMGYGMLFLVGLLTSVHCIAMCGGINLTQCLPKAASDAENQSKFSSFLPSFFYNLGRVVSYTVIGFLLGGAGRLFSGGSGEGLPVFVQGILKLIAGVFMVIMGINMLGIFPWLRKVNLRMPKFLAAGIGKKKAAANQPFLVGLLNGLMPCGPLQSMQIVALACANPFAGALSMFLFSLGTVPLMLGLGSIVSALGKKFTQIVMNIGAVLVVVLGLAMLSQGGSLSGLLLPNRLLIWIIALSILGIVASIPFRKTLYRAVSLLASIAVMVSAGAVWSHIAAANNQTPSSVADQAELSDGVQIVYSTLAPGSYPDITVQAGTPVKWIIDAPDGSINGCNYKVIIEEYGLEYSFQTGENILEFTPTQAGTYEYTCWMGMIHGTICVTQASAAAASDTTTIVRSYGSAGDSGQSTGGSSCCGTSGANSSCCGGSYAASCCG